MGAVCRERYSVIAYTQASALFLFLSRFTQADLGQLGDKLELGNNPDSLAQRYTRPS